MPNDIARAIARHEDVARRAYELYEQRGRADGHDWAGLVPGGTRTQRHRDADSHHSNEATSPTRRTAEPTWQLEIKTRQFLVPRCTAAAEYAELASGIDAGGRRVDHFPSGAPRWREVFKFLSGLFTYHVNTAGWAASGPSIPNRAAARRAQSSLPLWITIAEPLLSRSERGPGSSVTSATRYSIENCVVAGTSTFGRSPACGPRGFRNPLFHCQTSLMCNANTTSMQHAHHSRSGSAGGPRIRTNWMQSGRRDFERPSLAPAQLPRGWFEGFARLAAMLEVMTPKSEASTGMDQAGFETSSRRPRLRNCFSSGSRGTMSTVLTGRRMCRSRSMSNQPRYLVVGARSVGTVPLPLLVPAVIRSAHADR